MKQLTDKQKIARLLSVVRRFMMEHSKGSSGKDYYCLCKICEEGRKVLALMVKE